MILAKVLPLAAGRWSVTTPYHPRVVELCQQIPGMIWDRGTRVWTGYTDAVELLSRRLQTERIAKIKWDRPVPKDGAWDRQVALSKALQDDPRLRSYQREGVEFLIDRAEEGVLLGDDLGTGKTRQSLCAIEKLELPAVIVCPAVVKRNWVHEGQQLGMDILALHGTNAYDDAKLTESDGIVVINYDIIHAWDFLLDSAKTIVFDEAHYLINERSRRSRICKEIAKKAKYRIAATATPLTNTPKDLWNLVDTISPGRFGGFYKYGLRYCEGKQIEIERGDGDTKLVWDWKGRSNVEELSERMRGFTIRRLKKDVQKELPPLIRQVLEVDVANDTLAFEWSLKSTKAARLALSVAAQSKIPHAVELAAEIVERGSNAVIFCHEKVVVREMVAALVERGITTFSATGENSADERERIAQQAQKDGPSVLVVTTHSVGVGVNYLTYADHAIFLELDYEPHWLLQAEGRLHRTGQLRTVHVRYLVAIGTIDEAIRDAVLNKFDTFEQMFGSADESFKTDLKKKEEDSLAELRDYLTKIGREYYAA